MDIKLINIGFGNIVSASRIIAIVSPESAPIKRIIQEARDAQRLLRVIGDPRLEDVLHRDALPAREKPEKGPRERAAPVVCLSVQKIHGCNYTISPTLPQRARIWYNVPHENLADPACPPDGRG